MSKVAVNGLGRIGRATLQIFLEQPELELVAINDLVPPEKLAYLLKYDMVYGRNATPVDWKDNSLQIADQPYKVLTEKDLAQLS